MGDVGGKLFGKQPAGDGVRHYYIKAEPVVWDYAPQARDPICGKPLPPAVEHQRTATKFLYRQYSDATFTRRVMEEPRLGIMGPALRGMVGDTLVVTFLNGTNQPLSMHPHGVRYDKDNEGSLSLPAPGLGSAIGPGAVFTYVWQLDEASGPLPTEPSSKAWLYHSHAAGDEEIQLGLIGMIIVTDPKRARPDGTPNDVDREMASLFMIFDESGLSAEAAEAAEYVGTGTGLGAGPTKTFSEVQELTEQGARFAINGYIFGNLPGLEMNEGERVRWYLFGMGSEEDFHTAHWHGARVLEDGRRRTDVTELLPGSMKVADMVADNPGQWLYHCHVTEHMREGMYAGMTIHPRSAPRASRVPEDAFLGLRNAGHTLEISKARLERDGTSLLRVLGKVTVSDANAVFRQDFQAQIGGQTLSFTLDRTGRCIRPEGSLRVINANNYGVVYGGILEFELLLKADAWLPANGVGHELPMTLSVVGVEHRATVRWEEESAATEQSAAVSPR